MLTLPLAMRADNGGGEPLPPVYAYLESIGAKARRGQITMVAAIPGGAKSLLMLDWVLDLGNKDQYGMYFSPDTDRMTLGKRAVADLMQIEIDAAERLLDEKDAAAWQILEDKTSHMWCSFDPNLTLEDIEQEMICYALTNGRWPDFVVIDVLMNVQGDSGATGDHTAFAEAMEYFHGTARNTGAAFFVLHHVTGEWESRPDTPIPMGGILGKVTKLARLILTLHRPPPGDRLGVSVVKNTSGKADTAGWNVRTTIPFDPACSYFMKDFPKQEESSWSPTGILGDQDNEIEEEDELSDWDRWNSGG